MFEFNSSYTACQRGEHGVRAKEIQEWLCLNGLKVQIDGDFGGATEAAVKRFQAGKGLPVTGVVDRRTFELLVAPITAALKPIASNGRGLGDLTVAYAQQHLKQHPMEVGGQNRGPWVRLYMDGHEGAEWAWCAGFAFYCLKQACDTLSVPLPLPATPSCDVLAMSAKNLGLLLTQPSHPQRSRIRPGSFFLVRRTPTDWTHTGIVVSAEPEVFHTIEGNTNDSGSREGFEVCARVRAYVNKDFVIFESAAGAEL